MIEGVAGEVVAVYAGAVGTLRHRGRDVRSAIDKQPCVGPVMLRATGLDGDEQADPRFHGGADQAVCVYPGEHYGHWESLLGPLGGCAFGENLTTRGLLEHAVCIGDTYEYGTAVVQVTQPRVPCYKPAARHNRRQLTRWMRDSGRVGFYLRVLRPGVITIGDWLRGMDRAHPDLTIAAVHDALTTGDPAAITRALAAQELGSRYRAKLTALKREPGA